jgi:hypothetical protein
MRASMFGSSAPEVQSRQVSLGATVPSSSVPVRMSCTLPPAPPERVERGFEHRPNLIACCAGTMWRAAVSNDSLGSVYMDCKEGRCSCHLRAHAPPETVVQFEFAASCSSTEVMRQLMRDHCVTGMEVLEAPSEN